MPKIPPHATRVFKGEIFDIYQWQQALFDGSTATFEAARRANTVIVIPVAGDDVYYSHQEQPGKPAFIGLFGGRAEGGEDPLTTGKRELLEEAGLESDDWELLLTDTQGSKLDWTVYTYIARNCKITRTPHLDAGEKITIKKCSLDALPDLIRQPNFAEIELKRYLFSALNSDVLKTFRHKLTGASHA